MIVEVSEGVGDQEGLGVIVGEEVGRGVVVIVGLGVADGTRVGVSDGRRVMSGARQWMISWTGKSCIRKSPS